MNLKAWFAVFLVMLGCASNVVVLEALIKVDPGAGNTITFCQFSFIALEGLIITTKCLTVPNKIPMVNYLKMNAIFVVVNVMNNYAFYFNIPMTLHMIFRAGSLIANMLLGVIILRKSYTVQKYLAVLCISFGIFLATWASSKQKQETSESAEKDSDGSFWQLVGIGLLLFALVMSAVLGIFQEKLYSKFGKHSREAMFFSHALPLPAFLIFAPEIFSKFQLYIHSKPLILFGGVHFPRMIFWLLCNVITQYVCIRGVFILTTECPSLVVTLVVTLRKFVSLLISIWYFQNPFTATHWVATALVFGGTLSFTGVVAQLWSFREKAKRD